MFLVFVKKYVLVFHTLLVYRMLCGFLPYTYIVRYMFCIHTCIHTYIDKYKYIYIYICIYIYIHNVCLSLSLSVESSCL